MYTKQKQHQFTIEEQYLNHCFNWFKRSLRLMAMVIISLAGPAHTRQLLGGGRRGE